MADVNYFRSFCFRRYNGDVTDDEHKTKQRSDLHRWENLDEHFRSTRSAAPAEGVARDFDQSASAALMMMMSDQPLMARVLDVLRSSSQSVEERQSRLNTMIDELQSLKRNLGLHDQADGVGGSSSTVSNTIHGCFFYQVTATTAGGVQTDDCYARHFYSSASLAKTYFSSIDTIFASVELHPERMSTR